jgi:hypothetical protein
MRVCPVLIVVLAAGGIVVDSAALAADDGVRIPDQKGGTVVIPPSSIPKPGEAGKAGHTNVQIYRPPPPPPQSPPSSIDR